MDWEPRVQPQSVQSLGDRVMFDQQLQCLACPADQGLYLQQKPGGRVIAQEKDYSKHEAR